MWRILVLILLILLIIKFRYGRETFTINKNKYDVYVINLKKDVVRWKYIRKKLINQDFKTTRIEGIDGKILNFKEKKYTQIFTSNKLSPSQKGCALSHIMIWNKLLNGHPEDLIIILEDDAIIPNNLNEKLDMYIKQAPTNWDMIILGGNRFKGTYYSKNLIKPVINKYGNWGTFGYMIKRKCIKKLLDCCQTMDNTIDHYLNLNFYSQNNVYFCNPQIIKHNYNYHSNILNKKRSEESIRNNKITII